MSYYFHCSSLHPLLGIYIYIYIYKYNAVNDCRQTQFAIARQRKEQVSLHSSLSCLCVLASSVFFYPSIFSPALSIGLLCLWTLLWHTHILLCSIIYSFRTGLRILPCTISTAAVHCTVPHHQVLPSSTSTLTSISAIVYVKIVFVHMQQQQYTNEDCRGNRVDLSSVLHMPIYMCIYTEHSH